MQMLEVEKHVSYFSGLSSPSIVNGHNSLVSPFQTLLGKIKFPTFSIIKIEFCFGFSFFQRFAIISESGEPFHY